jgi:DNA-binding NarL/FixJ family response regulator
MLSGLIVKHYLLNRKMLAQGPLAFLSHREQQVCQAVLQGKKNEIIADELGVSLNSVVTYRKRAYEKLGISSRAQLFALCQ